MFESIWLYMFFFYKTGYSEKLIIFFIKNILQYILKAFKWELMLIFTKKVGPPYNLFKLNDTKLKFGVKT